MAGDPVFDENLIIELLKSAVTIDNIGRIQQGAVHTLVSLYDRGVTRDEFTTAASLCLALYGQAAKRWVLGNIEQVYDSGELDKERFATAGGQLEDIIRKQCVEAIEILKRLRECPTSQDKIH